MKHMRVRRLAVILLVVGVIGGALAGFFRGEKGGVEERRSVAVEGLDEMGDSAWMVDRQARGGAEQDQDVLAVEGVEATAEENALVAEMVGLRQMAVGTGLELAPDEWVKLAQVTRRMQGVRSAVEAEIGAVSAVAPGRWRMDVPGYVEAGAAMRARFFGEIGEVLGTNVAVEVIDKLGPAFEGYFAGFGVSLQTLEIVGGEREWRVTRTVAYSKEANGGEQMAVRRETFFAGEEEAWVGKLRVEG